MKGSVYIVRVVHRDADETEAHDSAMANEQYWITAMETDVDEWSMTYAYVEEQSVVINGVLPMTTDHDLLVTFYR